VSATDQRLHPVSQMTTYELAAYKSNLERALSAEALPEDGPSRAQLRKRLDVVLAEQQERASIRRASMPTADA
jgi:hypothetical protein